MPTRAYKCDTCGYLYRKEAPCEFCGPDDPRWKLREAVAKTCSNCLHLDAACDDGARANCDGENYWRPKGKYPVEIAREDIARAKKAKGRKATAVMFDESVVKGCDNCGFALGDRPRDCPRCHECLPTSDLTSWEPQGRFPVEAELENTAKWEAEKHATGLKPHTVLFDDFAEYGIPYWVVPNRKGLDMQSYEYEIVAPAVVDKDGVETKKAVRIAHGDALLERPNAADLLQEHHADLVEAQRKASEVVVNIRPFAHP